MGLLSDRKLGFVFPGQGSQHVGMGRELAEHFPVAAELFERADATLGFSIKDICFNGPEDALTQTINTQPALFVVSAVCCEVAVGNGLTPTIAAGHSVGEYAALYAAGAFSFEDGVRLVRERAELMQKAGEERPGAMAAILGLSPEQAAEAAAKAMDWGIVTAANFNSPIQTVVSGEKDAVAKASEIAMEMGAKRVVPLNVSGAFHSPLMRSAADGLREVLNAADIHDLAFPVVANVTAKAETRADEVRQNLAAQITGSVRWVESVQTMIEAGVDEFVEMGPGSVLAGLIKRISPDIPVGSAHNVLHASS